MSRRRRDGLGRRCEVLHFVAFGQDLQRAVIGGESGVGAMEIDAEPPLGRGVALKVEAVAVGQGGHPRQREVRVLPEDLVVVVGVAVVLEEVAAAGGAGPEREAEVERPDREVNDVRRHARRPAAAVVHPGAVVVGVVGKDGVERAQRRAGRTRGPNRSRPAAAWAALWPTPSGIWFITLKVRTAATGPRLPERIELDHAPVVLGGVNLRADLADDVVLLDGVADGEALCQVQRHRLLEVNVLACLASGDGDQRMPVRRGGDDHGVKVRLLQHLAEVAIALAGVLELLHHSIAPGFPRIARGGDDDIGLAGASAEVSAAHAAAADQAEVDTAVGAGFGPGCRRRGASKVRCGKVQFTNLSHAGNQQIWDLGDGTTSTMFTPPPHLYLTAGDSTISLYVTSANGCRDSAKHSLLVNPLPDIAININKQFCSNRKLLLIATTNGDSVLWTPGFIRTLTDTVKDLPAAKTSMYKVNVKIAATKCASTDSIKVYIPDVIISPVDTTIVTEGTNKISVILKDSSGIDTFKWTPLTGLSCSKCLNPVITLSNINNTYIYTLVVYDRLGCFTDTAKVNVIINIDTTETYALPKAFRPGSEGVNGVFKILGSGIKQLLEFKIFNRYGNMVFSTTDLSEGWDGTYNGHIQPVDTYIYTVTVQTTDGNISTKKGAVLLLR